MKNIAIFASGTGSNAAAIMDRFIEYDDIFVSLAATNKPDAGVLDEAHERGVPTRVFTKKELHDEDYMHDLLLGIDVVVLAGFLLKIPPFLVEAFQGRMINIHPSLLPKYGGKGMYGMRVHEAVLENNEKESGITIHYVSENYDEGDILRQEKVSISQRDTARTIALKVQKLEHEHYPKIVEKLVRSLPENYD